MGSWIDSSHNPSGAPRPCDRLHAVETFRCRTGVRRASRRRPGPGRAPGPPWGSGQHRALARVARDDQRMVRSRYASCWSASATGRHQLTMRPGPWRAHRTPRPRHRARSAEAEPSPWRRRRVTTAAWWPSSRVRPFTRTVSQARSPPDRPGDLVASPQERTPRRRVGSLERLGDRQQLEFVASAHGTRCGSTRADADAGAGSATSARPRPSAPWRPAAGLVRARRGPGPGADFATVPTASRRWSRVAAGGRRLAIRRARAVERAVTASRTSGGVPRPNAPRPSAARRCWRPSSPPRPEPDQPLREGRSLDGDQAPAGLDEARTIWWR